MPNLWNRPRNNEFSNNLGGADRNLKAGLTKKLTERSVFGTLVYSLTKNMFYKKMELLNDSKSKRPLHQVFKKYGNIIRSKIFFF